MIHTTIGVYPNGSYKTNGVSSENLATHIWYNMRLRPGRSLYVDGVLIYRGIGISDELVELWGKETAAAHHVDHKPKGKAATIKLTKDTAPYQ